MIKLFVFTLLFTLININTAISRTFYLDKNKFETVMLKNGAFASSIDLETNLNEKIKDMKFKEMNDEEFYNHSGIKICYELKGDLKVLKTEYGDEQVFCFFKNQEFIDTNGLLKVLMGKKL